MQFPGESKSRRRRVHGAPADEAQRGGVHAAAVAGLRLPAAAAVPARPPPLTTAARHAGRRHTVHVLYVYYMLSALTCDPSIVGFFLFFAALSSIAVPQDFDEKWRTEVS